VEIYGRDELLQEHLRAERLQVLTDRWPVTLRASEVTLRFNNRDRVRAEQTPLLLGAAVGAAVASVLVLLNILGWWPPTRPARPPV
jgi:hypothetical protein